MKRFLFALPRPVWAPEDGAAAAATGTETGSEGAGSATKAAGDAATAGTGDTGPGGGDAATAAAGAAAGKWWEGDFFSDDQRTTLTAAGLTVDDPRDAVKRLVDMERSAQRKLGKPADQLMEKPKEGQDIAEYRRANAALFGVPESAEKYAIDKPADWPKDQEWDSALEGEARKIAFDRGLSNQDANAFVALHAKAVMELTRKTETDFAAANTAMMADLERDWGPQTTAKLAAVQQAASVIAEKAGFDPEQMLSLSQSLKTKVGDAGTIRLFSAIADMMGDDAMVGAGKGGGSLGTTPAEARQQIAALRAPDGAYGKAYGESNRTEMARLQPEIDRLTKIAAGG